MFLILLPRDCGMLCQDLSLIVNILCFKKNLSIFLLICFWLGVIYFPAYLSCKPPENGLLDWVLYKWVFFKLLLLLFTTWHVQIHGSRIRRASFCNTLGQWRRLWVVCLWGIVFCHTKSSSYKTCPVDLSPARLQLAEDCSSTYIIVLVWCAHFHLTSVIVQYMKLGFDQEPHWFS